MFHAYFHPMRMPYPIQHRPFSGQHKNGESPPNILFLKTFRTGRTHFLSAPCIAAESQHHEESHLIHGPLESTLLDQRVPSWTWIWCMESATHLSHLQLLLCRQRRTNTLRHPTTSSLSLNSKPEICYTYGNA